METDLLNTFSDIIVPVYTVLVVILIVLYNKRKVSVNSNPDRLYKYVKKGTVVAGTWQQQMAGTWDKVERNHFYEFMIFNGAPSFVASLKKDSAFGQIITFYDNDTKVKVNATGTPSADGPVSEIGTCASDAKLFDGKDMGGRLFKQKTWYEEDTKMWMTHFSFVVEGNTLLQKRQLMPDGRLHLRAEMTKPDGRMDYFEAYFRKV